MKTLSAFIVESKTKTIKPPLAGLEPANRNEYNNGAVSVEYKPTVHKTKSGAKIVVHHTSRLDHRGVLTHMAVVHHDWDGKGGSFIGSVRNSTHYKGEKSGDKGYTSSVKTTGIHEKRQEHRTYGAGVKHIIQNHDNNHRARVKEAEAAANYSSHRHYSRQMATK